MSRAATVGNSRHSGYARAEHDWYVEPAWAVEALLAVEPFSGYSHDPACGGGTIPEVFWANSLPCGASDIVDRGYYRSTVSDFLSQDIGHVTNIVTNPPFHKGLAEAFAKKALEVADQKVAILERLAWLESGKRRALFESTCLARVWVFSKRVSMRPGGLDIPAKGGSIPYAWFVWDKTHEGRPTLGWIS